MPASAWDSPILTCASCQGPGCRFRARADLPFCCDGCARRAVPVESQEPGDAQAQSDLSPDGHDRNCARLLESEVRMSWWESVRGSDSSEEDAACLVMPPVEDVGRPAPVIIFLTGNGHLDGRQDFLWGGPDMLRLHPVLRRHYMLLAPKPTSASGLIHWSGHTRARSWDEDVVWAVCTEVLRRLGPASVDPSRLYVTGISLGAIAVWNIAVRFGQHLAAIAPISGRCDWPGSSWPRGSGPDPQVSERLAHLGLCAYQIDVDSRAGNPTADLEWLCYDLEVNERSLVLPGVDPGTSCDVQVREWQRPKGGATWEYWVAKGPLHDTAGWASWGGDRHCLWTRVYTLPEWNLAEFFSRHAVPKERCWQFDTPAAIPVEPEQLPQRMSEGWSSSTDGWWSAEGSWAVEPTTAARRDNWSAWQPDRPNAAGMARARWK